MDCNTFAKFIKSHGVDTSMCDYFAPETPYKIIKYGKARNPDESQYLKEVSAKLTQIYGDKTQNILTAAVVLTENCEAFERRVNGIIVDEWLSYKNFHNIRDSVILILNRLKNRNTVQNKLLIVFKAMMEEEN